MRFVTITAITIGILAKACSGLIWTYMDHIKHGCVLSGGPDRSTEVVKGVWINGQFWLCKE